MPGFRSDDSLGFALHLPLDAPAVLRLDRLVPHTND
jgi:hypothetical protein